MPATPRPAIGGSPYSGRTVAEVDRAILSGLHNNPRQHVTRQVADRGGVVSSVHAQPDTPEGQHHHA